MRGFHARSRPRGQVRAALSSGEPQIIVQVPKSQLSLAGEQVEDEAGFFSTHRDPECQVNMLKSLDHPHIVRVFEARAPL